MRAHETRIQHLRRTLLCAAVSACFSSPLALANPTGPAVAAGSASFATAGKTLTVTNTPSAIINWQGFSIGAGEATRFQQQSAASAVMNRVVGQDPSASAARSSGRSTATTTARTFLRLPAARRRTACTWTWPMAGSSSPRGPASWKSRSGSSATCSPATPCRCRCRNPRASASRCRRRRSTLRFAAEPSAPATTWSAPSGNTPSRLSEVLKPCTLRLSRPARRR